MDSAMLPSLRIDNTLTSKTIKFGRKETALKVAVWTPESITVFCAPAPQFGVEGNVSQRGQRISDWSLYQACWGVDGNVFLTEARCVQ